MGTRILERSGGLPKALIPVLGKPFLFYQLEWLARQDVRDVVMSVGYKGELIKAAVGNGKNFGLSVTYAEEGSVLRGTGGALRYAADLGLLQNAFFVVYGTKPERGPALRFDRRAHLVVCPLERRFASTRPLTRSVRLSSNCGLTRLISHARSAGEL